LTGALLAAMFSGRITAWNDPQIQAVNPNVKLPALPIVCVARAEPSGTTAGFTEYLSKVDPSWASQIGNGLQVAWAKQVVQVKGNEAMLGAVRDRAGALGYVSANAVGKNHLVYPLLQNRAHNFVAPTNEALLAAVKSSTLSREGEKLSYVDMPSSDAWPITDATYILLDRSPKDPARATTMLRFIYWSFLRGDAMASETGYVPLPATIQARALGMLKKVRNAQDTPLDFMSAPLRGGNVLDELDRSTSSVGLLAALAW
ncbi:MAG: substrate-binding domain-containing protein, partial [Pseudomonadota bacterium]|nr:substrate-binding domain-containing protein [Pseudomonadota bacterium]